MICAIPQKRLERVALAAGLSAAGSERFGSPGQDTDWRITRGQRGWLAIERPAEGYAGEELIMRHADWSGPVKLVAGPDGPVQRIDVFLAKQLSGRFDPFLHAEAEEDFDRMLSGVLEHANALFVQDQAVLVSWTPPEAKRLAAWLAHSGHPVATDQRDNLRTTIRASGRDGQVRVLCGEGQLRFVLPLGSWRPLAGSAEAAMLKLAHQANNHLRLARIAWRNTEGGCSCEAQADLTGLVPPDTSNDSDASVMGDMVQLAVDALRLALRQLKHELEILADPQHKDLAEVMFFD